ncbi:MAG: type II secretion system protein [Clostridia bacterium]|nr:type II secretion system protein [Clostridia bacterium]
MKKRQGISLIVLVITIIVMIILAAAVVITLSNTGIIDRAGKAVDLTNEASVQDLAALVRADTYMDGKRDSELESIVTTKLSEQGVTSDKWNITISNTGIVVTSKTASVKKITFTIDGETLEAEEGMTWQEFVDSDYNTKNVYIYAGVYVRCNGQDVYDANGPVGPTVDIVEGETYYLQVPEPS